MEFLKFNNKKSTKQEYEKAKSEVDRLQMSRTPGAGEYDTEDRLFDAVERDDNRKVAAIKKVETIIENQRTEAIKLNKKYEFKKKEVFNKLEQIISDINSLEDFMNNELGKDHNNIQNQPTSHFNSKVLINEIHNYKKSLI
ncbi:MAG: hypothetical protein IPO78_10295 [Saprospiraceae bacterium]|nr:hypothetical protein [Saprospiraceae bacterium]